MTATPTVGTTFFGLDISQLTTRLLSMRRRISKRVLVVEFGSDVLLLAEASLTQTGVQLSHVSSFALPPEALDRGVPAEPLQMARLIQDFCTEKKIPAHRAAVVLPPELAFQRLLDLPAFLTTEEAREYVLNPANGLQIPFPLTQTDFDLFPVSTPKDRQQADGKRLYMLTAIPEVLVDPIVEMLQAADLELQLLELGSHSQLRNHAADLVTLASQQVDLVLELLPDCSNLMLVSCSGLLGSERLAAIRNLPVFDLDPEQLAVALESGLSAESLLLKEESYLPLSDLDLRVLVSDLRSSFERFHLKLPDAQIRRVILTGVNSSHPLLADLLREMLGLPVVLARSTVVTGLAGLSMDALLLQSGLGRLTGLALGLLSTDQLLACSLDAHALNVQESESQEGAVAIAELLSSSEAQTGLDLVAVEAPMADSVTEDDELLDPNTQVDTDVEVVSVMDSDLLVRPELGKDAVDAPDQSLVSPITMVDPGSRPTGEPTEASRSQDLSEIVVDDLPLDPSSEQEWPSIASSHADHQSDLGVLEDVPPVEEQWPSITASDSALEDEWPSITTNESLDDVSTNESASVLEASPSSDGPKSEALWPSITPPATGHQSALGALEDVVPAEEQWPSITTSDSLLEDEWPSITANELSNDASTNASAPILEVSSSSDGPMPEDLSPFIDSADSVDQSFGTDVAVDNEEVAWPSIASGQQQEPIDSLNRLETQESAVQGKIEDVDEYDDDQVSSSLPLDQTSGAEPSNVEGLVFTNSLEEGMADGDVELLIPDLPIAPEAVESQNSSDGALSESDDSAASDVLEGLGELRFADED